MSSGAIPGRLQIWFERDDRLVVIGVEGEVDIENAEQLSSSLRRAPTGDEVLILDLRLVPFIDSSGLKVLLVAAGDFGNRLALAMNTDSPVLALLDLAHVRDRFAIYDTPEAAIDVLIGGKR
jgi:stage II sporulation protein AA (anti-sigma F factor antagonist)